MRVPQDKINKKNIDMSVPVLFTSADDDSCFGKEFSLKDENCNKICGDSQICQIVFSQKLNAKREKIEQIQKFKDIEETKIPKKKLTLRGYIRRCLKKGVNQRMIIQKSLIKFETTEKQIKKIINQLKNNE